MSLAAAALVCDVLALVMLGLSRISVGRPAVLSVVQATSATRAWMTTAVFLLVGAVAASLVSITG